MKIKLFSNINLEALINTENIQYIVYSYIVYSMFITNACRSSRWCSRQGHLQISMRVIISFA